MIKAEEKNIQRFIAENGLKVKEGWDGQTTFDKDVYYHYSNGVYMKVIDQGGKKAEAGKTTVLVRFRGKLFSDKDILSFDNLSKADYQDTEFRYIDEYMQGALHFQLLPASPGENLNGLMCEGVAFPLTMVGDGARVSLIVPFLRGPELAYSAGATVYFEEVLYQFTN